MTDIFYCDKTIERFNRLKDRSNQRHHDNFMELVEIAKTVGLGVAIFDFNILLEDHGANSFLTEFFYFRPAMIGVYSKCDDELGIIILLDRVRSLCELVSIFNHELIHFFQEHTGNFIFPKTKDAWELVKEDEDWHPDTAGADTRCWWEFEAYKNMRSIRESIKVYKKLIPNLPPRESISRQIEDFDPYNP